MPLVIVKDLPPNEQAIFLSLVKPDEANGHQYVLNAANAKHYLKVYMAQINSVIANLPTDDDAVNTPELRALLRRVHHQLEDSYQLLLAHNAEQYPQLLQLSQQIAQQTQYANQQLSEIAQVRSYIEMVATVLANVSSFARVAGAVLALV
ncbi:hypothetical protein [Alcaligenes endophyticus]|uniref:Chemotaxis protein n=1 Tax=Alcaligenes endophyticus TaxID=1929088 RepID=A0ABT8EFT6_9BURK|nr:hypothetical protein [Alcaligenes endophyticus]MCX5590213.1 hypothetical protein [Alcaligenes endophyticus]MDN4120123.1 hypothetical protein [Alcaligenes endophyticus]